MSTLTISSASELNLFKVEGVLGNDRTEEGELHRLEADVVQLDRGESVGDVWIQESRSVGVCVDARESVGVCADTRESGSVGDVWIQERVEVWVYVWIQERVEVWVYVWIQERVRVWVGVDQESVGGIWMYV